MRYQEFDAQVPLDIAFEHLGGWTTASGKMGPELAKRRTEAGSALGIMRRTILNRDEVDLKDKCTLAETLFSKRLTYNAAAWNPLTESEELHLEALHAGALRGPLKLPRRNPEQSRVSADRVTDRCGGDLLSIRLRTLRLKYLGRLATCGAKELLVNLYFLLQ